MIVSSSVLFWSSLFFCMASTPFVSYMYHISNEFIVAQILRIGKKIFHLCTNIFDLKPQSC